MLVKGRNDTTTKTGMATAHLQEYGALRKAGDKYGSEWVGISPPIFCRIKTGSGVTPERVDRHCHTQHPWAVQGHHIKNNSAFQVLRHNIERIDNMSILRGLYNGKIIPWERREPYSAERLELVRKIEIEERYFVEKMSLDDCQRFQALSNLQSSLSILGEE
ncbi:hypothetical protein LJC63_06710, partial [Ruminococcaceae bacterium OttesenSCG-928-L11]|nr:hypothetical protein [Ruminococcaceae bacterium OttesenSCG-928-L11]